MTRQTDGKRERMVEAVRLGFEGDAAVAFIHTSGHVVTSAGIARHLRALGGRGEVLKQIKAGKSNEEILAGVTPSGDRSKVSAPSAQPRPAPTEDELFPTRKITLRISTDLYEAIRVASRVTGLSQQQVIVDTLTRGLSQIPDRAEEA